MAAPRKTPAQKKAEFHFVVYVKREIADIGPSSEGGDTPVEAAFKAIARCAEPGDFEFTMPARMSPTGEVLTTRLSVNYDRPE